MMIIVTLIAIFLRFFNLGVTPSGLFVDEASIGYNAYSILKTGNDEYGKSFPILIKSFGDYKAPVYTYLLIPVYKIFGMNMASTRSVSAVAGVITIIFLFLLIKLISGNKRLAVLSSLVLAISPWHILLSRAAIEANVALMFMVIGLWAFFKYIKGAKNYLIITAISTAISFASYHSERIVLPLLYLTLAYLYRKTIFKKEGLVRLMKGLITGLIILTPTLLILNTPAFFARTERVSILGLQVSQLWGFIDQVKILNNRFLLFAREWLSLYIAYFSPKYIFGPGNAILRNVYPDVGPFLFWMLPFLLAGIVKLIRSKASELKTLIILLMIISPIPASLVREPFGIIRAETLVIPLSILIGMGIDAFATKRKFNRTAFIAILFLLGIIRIGFSAFKLNDFYRYQYWDYGTDKVVAEINKLPDQKIQVDGWRAEVYSQLLFFLKYDPAKYQADNGIKDLNNYYNNEAIDQIRHIGRITVKSINWDRDALENKIIIGSYKVMGDDQINRYRLTKVFEIRAPDNSILFTGARTNPEAILK